MKTLALDHRFVQLREDFGNGPVVLFVHAFPFDHAMWKPQLAPVAEAGFRIAPDLPEFGESTPGSEVFAIERAARTWSPISWKHSTSSEASSSGYRWAATSCCAIRRHPERLRQLVLADTKAAPDDASARANRDRLIADVKGGGAAAVVEALFPKLFCESTRKHNLAAIEEARGIVMHRPAAIIAGLYALRDRPDAAPRLPSIAVPTLVMVGEHDDDAPAHRRADRGSSSPTRNSCIFPARAISPIWRIQKHLTRHSWRS